MRAVLALFLICIGIQNAPSGSGESLRLAEECRADYLRLYFLENKWSGGSYSVLVRPHLEHLCLALSLQERTRCNEFKASHRDAPRVGAERVQRGQAERAGGVHLKRRRIQGDLRAPCTV